MRPAKPTVKSIVERVIGLLRSPRTVAPSSTVGVDCVTRSPPTSAAGADHHVAVEDDDVSLDGPGDVRIPVQDHQGLLGRSRRPAPDR